MPSVHHTCRNDSSMIFPVICLSQEARGRLGRICALFVALLTPTAQAASPVYPEDLSELTLEQLVNIEITSVSRYAEPLSRAAAAVSVITGDDIRRSGATSLAEALRLAPAVQVGRVDAHTWAISTRGFANVYANKLLVMMDGRTLYTPLFSGTQWWVQDTLLEDIDRIEVIRGPGSTLWGANAVNGVINITTRSSRQTQGGLISAGFGSEEAFGAFRYGGRISKNATFRVYGKYLDHEASRTLTGEDANDAWKMWRGGFRYDWEPSREALFTLQGDIYDGVAQQTFHIPTVLPPYVISVPQAHDNQGASLIGRWTRQGSDSQISLQAYAETSHHDTVVLGERRHTLDLDFQHDFSWGERQFLVWGAGYRLSTDKISHQTFALSFDPPRRTLRLASLFLQNETKLTPKLRFTAGAKLEHHDISGLELQPALKLFWAAAPHHSLWGSVARAVRTPSRAEIDSSIHQSVLPGNFLPVAPELIGNDAFDSESLLAYEIGYRAQPSPRLSLDASVFYHRYDHLRTFEPQTPEVRHSPSPHIAAPLLFDNGMDGESYGTELAVNLDLTRRWRLYASYAFMRLHLHKKPWSQDLLQENEERGSPLHQAALRSAVDLPGHFQWDTVLRFVDSLPALKVGDIVRFDIRLGWNPRPGLEFSLVGQNLLDESHQETPPSVLNTGRTETERSVYGKVTVRF